MCVEAKSRQKMPSRTVQSEVKQTTRGSVDCYPNDKHHINRDAKLPCSHV